jgi:hypothetical protein
VTKNNGFWNRWLDLLALLLQLQPVITSSQSMAAYDSLHSLIDHECLLFRCDEWRRKNPSWMNSTERSHVSTLYNFGRINRDHHPEQLVVILPLQRGRVLPNRCLVNRLPLLFVAIPAFRRCLPNRCLAMVIFVTIYFGAVKHTTRGIARGVSCVKRNSSVTERAPQGSGLSLRYSLHTLT